MQVKSYKDIVEHLADRAYHRYMSGVWKIGSFDDRANALVALIYGKSDKTVFKDVDALLTKRINTPEA